MYVCIYLMIYWDYIWLFVKGYLLNWIQTQAFLHFAHHDFISLNGKKRNNHPIRQFYSGIWPKMNR